MILQIMQAYKKYIGLFLLCILIFFVIGYRCPIHFILGIPCPGCNFTTSLYYLIHLDLLNSLYYHAMCIPTLFFFLLFFLFRKNKKVLHILIWIWIICMLVYYGYRMITIFPEYPMHINENSLLQKLLHIFG